MQTIADYFEFIKMNQDFFHKKWCRNRELFRLMVGVEKVFLEYFKTASKFVGLMCLNRNGKD